MAFFRSVSFSEQLPSLAGEQVLLRPPQMSDYLEWATLREASRDFLTPWEPTWPADDLTRASFRRRIKRYSEDQRGDLAYPFFIFRRDDNALVGGLTLANVRRGCAQRYPVTAPISLGSMVSRSGRSKAKRLDGAIMRLEQEHGGAVDAESLCAELQMSEQELQDLMDEMRPVRMVSLDSPDESEEVDERSLHDLIAYDTAASACDVVERKEMVALLAERIAQLPEIPKKVLAMYYYENLRLADIAACFGLTESRICQIHTQAIKQLRAYLHSMLA